MRVQKLTFFLVALSISLLTIQCGSSDNRQSETFTDSPEYYGYLFPPEKCDHITIGNDSRAVLPFGSPQNSQWFTAASGDTLVFSIAVIGEEKKRSSSPSPKSKRPVRQGKKKGQNRPMVNFVVAQWEKEDTSFTYDDLPCTITIEIEEKSGAKNKLLSKTITPHQDKRYQVWQVHSLTMSKWSGKEIRLLFSRELTGSEKNKLCITNPVLLNKLKPKQDSNAILITLDTLRSDHLGCYGYPGHISPELDRFSKQSLMYSRALTPSTWTLPAHMTMFTGVHSSVHRVLRHDSPPLSQDFPTMTELFRQSGYMTAGFTEGGFAGPDWGLDRGFQRYHFYALFDEHIENTLNWIDAHQGNIPFLIFLHTYEVHFPYNSRHPGFVFSPKPPPGENYETPVLEKNPSPAQLKKILHAYDDGVRTCDALFGRFFRALSSRGLHQNTSIIVCSDHGEEFWEHSGYKHGAELYRETLEVPLFVKLTNNTHPGLISKTVSLKEIFPTLLLHHQIPFPEFVRQIPLPETTKIKTRPESILSETVRSEPRVRLDNGEIATLAREKDSGGMLNFELLHLSRDAAEKDPLALPPHERKQLIEQWSRLHGQAQIWLTFKKEHYYDISLTAEAETGNNSLKRIYVSPNLSDNFTITADTLKTRIHGQNGCVGLQLKNVQGGMSYSFIIDEKPVPLIVMSGDAVSKIDSPGHIGLPLTPVTTSQNLTTFNGSIPEPFALFAFPEPHSNQKEGTALSDDTLEKLKELGYLSE